MQISYRICAEISSPDNLWKDKAGYRTDATEAMRIQRGRNNRSRSMPRPYSHARIDTAEVQRIASYGIAQGKEQSHDI